MQSAVRFRRLDAPLTDCNVSTQELACHSSVTELRFPMIILSIFPGIDLLGRAFEEHGACVVRGPDLLWGGDIRDFDPPAGKFDGVIGGSPCQDFSNARRSPPTGEGLELLNEFVSCVCAAQPDWFLLENVVGVPDVSAQGYTMQRFFLNARECGARQNRPRRFQFGSLDGVGVVIPPPAKLAVPAERCCMASEGERKERRSWEDFCELQGLPRSFTLPGLTRGASYAAVGNGVPLAMGRVLAAAIHRRHDTQSLRVCICGCGRVPTSNAIHASAACRKRMQRARAVTELQTESSGSSL